MSLFSILHIFAYPWKPYSLKHTPSDPLGAGYSTSGKHYKGGPLGIKALADAFNPWDIIKASARGFRWMFVGAKHRHEDVSYQPTKLGGIDDTGYMGPTYAMSGEAATKPVLRGGGTTTPEDDRAGLLHDAQAPAYEPPVSSSGPYHPITNDEFVAGDDGHIDLGVSRPVKATMPWAPDWKPDEYDEDPQADFHPGMGPPPGAGLSIGTSGSVHPAQRGETPAGFGWNHWGGVESPPEGRRYEGHD